jgi:hypothetical protein
MAVRMARFLRITRKTKKGEQPAFGLPVLAS